MTKAIARKLLREQMSHFSEERWCAGWLANLEYVIWEYMQEPDARHFRPETKEIFTQLHKEAGGWWYWESTPDPRNGGPKFVTTKKWLKMVEERAKQDGQEEQTS